jgi:hypothetical protein
MRLRSGSSRRSTPGCAVTSLIDGTLSLHDIVRMNEFLIVHAENEARAQEAYRDADG